MLMMFYILPKFPVMLICCSLQICDTLVIFGGFFLKFFIDRVTELVQNKYLCMHRWKRFCTTAVLLNNFILCQVRIHNLGSSTYVSSAAAVREKQCLSNAFFPPK